MLLITLNFDKDDDHAAQVVDAVNSTLKLPNDVTIVSGDNEVIPTNKFLLSMFSPTLHAIMSSLCCSSHTIILPDCSTGTLEHLINMITRGFCLTNKEEDMEETRFRRKYIKWIGCSTHF